MNEQLSVKNIAIGCVVIGLLLPMINLTVISGMATDGVISGVEDALHDGRDELSDWEDPEWLVTTSERTYFANSITNEEELESGDIPELEKMGPFIYTVTTTKEILEFDESAGIITYSEYDSFDWCSTCFWTDDNGVEHQSINGTTDVTQVNILYNTQLIAGLATGIDYGGIFAKAGFANNMISFELQNKAPSIWASNEISNDNVVVNGSSILDFAYGSWNESTSAGVMTPNFTSSIDMIMDGAVSDTGICIALTCEIGPMLVAGMGVPSSTTTAVRSALYGYSDVSEPELTHIDWSVYSLAATAFSNHGGGANLTEVDNLKERLEAVTESTLGNNKGVLINNPDALEYVLFGINEGTGNAAGLLTETDFFGIPLNGVALFLLGASGSPFDAMVEYKVGLADLLDLVDYAGRWLAYDNPLIGAPSEFPMILTGSSGTLNGNEWWLESFGGNEPINNGYLSIGMNRAAFEGTIDLSSEKANEILYTGANALTGDFATAFMYGELSGLSLPMTATGPMAGGEQVVWDNAYVASIYGISEEEAAALKSWVIDFMFPSVVPALLNFQYDASPYTTQSMNNWLYGWDDAVLEGLGRDSWVTLETNETYFGSDGLSTGDYTVYQMSTGTGANNADNMEHGLLRGYINSDGDGLCDFKLDSDGNAEFDVPCEANETYGMTEHLPWRAPHNEAASYGLLSESVGNTNTVWAGTIGGIADAEDPVNVNLVGYAIATSEVGDKVTYKDIPMIEHSISLDPAENQIQGKLIGSGTYVDAMPGALPVYFKSEVDIKVEPITNVAMYGKSTSSFLFDYRGPGNTDPDFNGEYMQTVFEIHTFSEISDDDAKIFKGKVLDHTGPFFWTDLGGSGDTELEALKLISYVSAAMYIGGFSLVLFGAVNLARMEDE
mgnify:FL=1|tara:strand:- start:920 stop:3613 length:2694 start_codon:yes stop_codon:yes gene_type:complete